MCNKELLSVSQLEEAYRISATIVKKYGEKYLPVFKRMHEELEQVKANQKLQKIALQVADSHLE